MRHCSETSREVHGDFQSGSIKSSMQLMEVSRNTQMRYVARGFPQTEQVGYDETLDPKDKLLDTSKI
jgi:hypothetical protein